jgi:predicted DNA-binding transcriptional regulator AlpA
MPHKKPHVVLPSAVSTESLVVDADGLAALLVRSVRSVWRDSAAGLIPRPVRVGRGAVRWRRDEIVRWIAAGCPAREQWERQSRP